MGIKALYLSVSLLPTPPNKVEAGNGRGRAQVATEGVDSSSRGAASAASMLTDEVAPGADKDDVDDKARETSERGCL